MNRTITVKGTGNITVSPDYVVISMDVKSIDKDYEKALNMTASKIDSLRRALVKIGFDKKALKTTRFDVDTEYESERDARGNYKSIFVG